MPSESQCRLVVLWEHELRVAAKAIKIVTDLSNKADRTDEEDEAFSVAVLGALNGCAIALCGVEDDDAVIVVSRLQPLTLKAKRKTP